MSSQSRRRAAAVAVAAAALAGALSVPTAAAQPAQPTQPAQPGQPTAPSGQQDAPVRVNPDRLLMTISQEYQTGAGGGQVSKLIDQAMTLRMQGFRPSMANAQALAAALDKRPNQTPLIEALRATVAYQRKLQLQSANTPAQQPGPQGPVGPQTPGAPAMPGWVPESPMQQDSQIFPMPGRS
ncbi:hypothetical protein CRI77_23985 [Mycolicibacterium duvalii]|uniref:Uncharacterized protein n=1 Tax=Mycolicibacterium duvalii TaxID=39688 RepID=A0A7I7JXI4_9MYCO|nr:hypothetical protein [Mycolicibacterium duvalii]MCV7366947.1 hypothetical protein [Mycolicibacterium duvalii]PEG35977.1 hypothetical protein CRI77_23985 [Mycolicibacterium duvalii]BBX16590.1 hypothetical protein MDUV_14500 [Mycolicibacterium duvalii]